MDEELEETDGIDDMDFTRAHPRRADPAAVVEECFPKDILDRYEIYSYRSAAVILKRTFPTELEEILAALRAFKLTTRMIRTAGGNESDIPKAFSASLNPLGWYETSIRADLHVNLSWKEMVLKSPRAKKLTSQKASRTIIREGYLDGHKIDYVKGQVAVDLEWNSKDQTFDRDLYAFNAFAQSGAIDVGVLITRSVELNDVFKSIGPSLTKKGEIEFKDGKPRPTMTKYGASTTWMGKLIPRLEAGRNGSCPILAIGIRPGCVIDWPLASEPQDG